VNDSYSCCVSALTLMIGLLRLYLNIVKYYISGPRMNTLGDKPNVFVVSTESLARSAEKERVVCFMWLIKLLLLQLFPWRQCCCESVYIECLCVNCQTLQTVASFLLLLVGLYLLRCLRHYRPFAVFGIIYGHAAVDIVVFAVSIYGLAAV